MFAIFGSGFGLYGYLPALAGFCSQRIVMPYRYHDKFVLRSELANFKSEIVWAENDNEALNMAHGAVLAIRPIDQPSWIQRCLDRPGITHLILEKPLAISPALAAAALEELVQSGKGFRIAYTFRYTTWGKKLRRTLTKGGPQTPLVIHWHFLAHHYRHNLSNWKRQVSTGGGVIRFFGIHIIALLAELGYDRVADSQASSHVPDEAVAWQATFSANGLPDCHIDINSWANTPLFCITQGGVTYADMSEPFAVEMTKADHDPRVGLLEQLCSSLWQDNDAYYQWYKSGIQLWAHIEDKTHYE